MKLNVNKIPYLLNFLMSFGYNAVSKIFPAFLTTITSSALQISFVSSAYNIGKIITGVMGGVFTDWFGKKKSLFISMAFIGIFSFFLMFGNNTNWYITMFFFLGIFSSLFYLSLNSVVTIINKEKGSSLSKMEIMYQAGFIIGPVVGGMIVLMFGMNILFFLWTILMLVGCIATLSLNFKDSKSSVKSVANDYIKIIKSNPFNFIFLIILSTIFIGAIEGARDILIPLYAVDLGFDIFTIGLIFAISSVVTMIGILPFGKVADKIGRKPVFLLSFIIIGISFLLLKYSNSFIFIGILTGVLSLGRSAGLMGARAIASDLSGANTRATSLAIVESVLSVGRIIGAVVAGFLKDTILIASTLKIFFWISIILFVFYLIAFIMSKDKIMDRK